MKSKLVTALLLVMALSYFAGSVLFDVRVASSTVSSSVFSVPALSSNVDGIGNFGNSVNITGNLVISGNNVTRFVGLSSGPRMVVYLNGSIEVTGNATLAFQNATLYFIGSQAPYDRYIRLSNASNGHPRLIVEDTDIISYTNSTFTVARRPVKTSRGGAILAYSGEIRGNGLAFYRQFPYSSYINLGGPTLIQCFGSTNVSLSNAQVDRIQSFDEANVSITIGNGIRGMVFDAFNFSRAYLSGVALNNVTVSDHAYVSLLNSGEVPGLATILALDFSKVDILAGTKTDYGLITTGKGGIVAAGNSSITVNGSIINSGAKLLQVLTAKDNSTVLLGNNCTVQGKIMTYNYSRVYVNNPSSFVDLNNLKDLLFVEHGFSHVYVVKSWLWTGVKTNEIQLFDQSGFSASDSNFDYAWIQAYNSTSLYFSNSTIRATDATAEGNANVILANGTSFTHAMEMRDNSSLLVHSSSVEILFGIDNSHITLTNGSIIVLSAKDASTLSAANSTISELSITSSNATGSLVNLGKFYASSTLTFPGTSVEVNVSSTFVNGLDFLFSGDSRVSISNSTIINLSLQGNSVANLTSMPGPLASLSLTGNSKAYVWAPLRVRTVDYFGNPVNGSAVSILRGYTYGSPVIGQGVTDEDGWVSFLLLSEFANATGRFPVGDVTVLVTVGGITTLQRTSLGFVNNDVFVSLPLPSWSRYIIPVAVVLAVVVILVLLAFVYGRIRRER